MESAANGKSEHKEVFVKTRDTFNSTLKAVSQEDSFRRRWLRNEPVCSSGDLHRTGACWDGSGGGNGDALKTGASLLQGQAETIGAAQPGESVESSELDPFQCLKDICKKAGEGKLVIGQRRLALN